MKQFLFLICFLKVTFVHANILFLGDFSLGESYQKKLELKKKTNYLKKFGPDHFFTHLGEFLKKSNQTVVNFESVITSEKKSPFEIHKNWLHYDRPNKIVKVLKKYNLQYLSLANNHSIDFSEKGLKDTFKTLQENKISFFGAGLNEKESLRPLVLKEGKKDVFIYGAFEYRKSYKKKYKAYATDKRVGSQSLRSKAFYENIKLHKKKNPKALHIAFVHWGKNYRFKTSKKQQKRTQKLLDAGINIIIGHGAHSIQKIERINGKWVLYNIGNFIFPSPGRYKKKKAYPYSLMVNLKGNTLKVYPIMTDNRVTNYKSHFLNKKNMKKLSPVLFPTLKNIERVKDKFGYFYKLGLQTD